MAKKKQIAITDGSGIDKDKFLQFLKMIKLEGLVKTGEVLFETSNTQLTIHARSIDRSFGFCGVFKGNFASSEEVGIANLELFIKSIGMMPNPFNINFKSNKLILESPTTNISFVIQKKEYIVNRLDSDKFNNMYAKLSKDSISFKLNSETVKDLYSKTDLVKDENVSFSAKDGKLMLKLKNNKEEIKLLSEYDKPEIKDNFDISLSEKFSDFLYSVKDNELTFTVPKTDQIGIIIAIDYDSFNIKYIFSLNTISEEEKSE